MRMRHLVHAAVLLGLVSTSPAAAAPGSPLQQAATRQPDVIFVPTPQEVVDAMLKLSLIHI